MTHQQRLVFWLQAITSVCLPPTGLSTQASGIFLDPRSYHKCWPRRFEHFKVTPWSVASMGLGWPGDYDRAPLGLVCLSNLDGGWCAVGSCAMSVSKGWRLVWSSKMTSIQEKSEVFPQLNGLHLVLLIGYEVWPDARMTTALSSPRLPLRNILWNKFAEEKKTISSPGNSHAFHHVMTSLFEIWASSWGLLHFGQDDKFIVYSCYLKICSGQK